ncbi:protein of unknown function [Vibrio tapetis subsp. tapetis]|uniref:Uncharacterized protein n=1 Tax=Vibrio tapetis subsp. tapetis TaxID=1671868 RepID=A0A2N8ZMR7_9VIBR|nr:protein of unknown function [Vibrio tapetis subsp. tapetis]
MHVFRHKSLYFLFPDPLISLCTESPEHKSSRGQIKSALGNKTGNRVSYRKFLVECAFDKRYVTTLLAVQRFHLCSDHPFRDAVEEN